MIAGKKGMAFAAGMFLGTLLGATTAALMAPASGRQLRSSLGKGAKKLAVKATDLVPETWNHIVEEEITKELVDNLSSLRSAGF